MLTSTTVTGSVIMGNMHGSAVAPSSIQRKMGYLASCSTSLDPLTKAVCSATMHTSIATVSVFTVLPQSTFRTKIKGAVGAKTALQKRWPAGLRLQKKPENRELVVPKKPSQPTIKR